MKKVMLCSLLLSANLNAMNNINDETAHQGIGIRISRLFSNFMSTIREFRLQRQRTLDQALIDAVSHNDSAAVEIAFRNGGNLNIQVSLYRESVPLISYAIRKSYVDAVRALISLGCNVDAVSSKGATPLIELAENYNLGDKQTEIGLLLLDHGANIDAQNNEGMNALMKACYTKDNFSFITLLLARGIDVNASSRMGVTALHAAAVYGIYGAIDLLLAAGADLEARDSNGMTAFFDAAMEKLGSTLRYLALKGADINTQDNLGRTPVHEAVYHDCLELLENLFSLGCNPNIQDNDGNTPLHLAILNERSFKVVKFLHDSGARMDIQNNAGITVLDIIEKWPHRGRSVRRRNILRISGLYTLNDQEKALLGAHYKSVTSGLINFVTKDGADVDVNAVNSYGENIFHLMARDIVEIGWNEDKIVVLNDFIKAGCNIAMLNDEGKSPLHIIAAMTNCLTTDANAVNYFSTKMNINKPDKDLNTPLHIAASQDGNSIVIIKALLGCPSIRINATNINGDTPLHFAAMNGAYRLVKLLLEGGANPNIANNNRVAHIVSAQNSSPQSLLKYVNGNTPLHLAVLNSWNYKESLLLNSKITIKVLLQCPSIRINAQNADRNTPLHLAVINRAYRLVELLLEGGADPDITNRAGQTPRMLAQQIGSEKMLRLFEEIE